MRKVFLLILLMSAACVRAPKHDDLAASQPVFSPNAFFSGDTRGAANLKVMFHADKPVRVRGRGLVKPDGTLVLDQIVDGASAKPEHREWVIRQTRPGHYAGTLSDAAGPIAGDVTGNCLHLRFPMKGGMAAEQWIYLQPGGRVALNHMTISKFGITVAALSETISKSG